MSLQIDRLNLQAENGMSNYDLSIIQMYTRQFNYKIELTITFL